MITQDAATAAAWDALFAGRGARSSIGHAQRATTSSRHPGVVFRGTIAYRTSKVEPCPRGCGFWRRAGDGPHAPRIATRDGRLVVVDCVGELVRKEVDEASP